eukprot:scaffold56177_cov18-Tisochrysis_lutea.AAC.3
MPAAGMSTPRCSRSLKKDTTVSTQTGEPRENAEAPVCSPPLPAAPPVAGTAKLPECCACSCRGRKLARSWAACKVAGCRSSSSKAGVKKSQKVLKVHEEKETRKLREASVLLPTFACASCCPQ